MKTPINVNYNKNIMNIVNNLLISINLAQPNFDVKSDESKYIIQVLNTI